jgi:hypothetical protein
VIQLKIKLANGIDRDVIVGSVCMTCDSRDLTPQEEVKRLVALLLGRDATPVMRYWVALILTGEEKAYLTSSWALSCTS